MVEERQKRAGPRRGRRQSSGREDPDDIEELPPQRVSPAALSAFSAIGVAVLLLGWLLFRPAPQAAPPSAPVQVAEETHAATGASGNHPPKAVVRIRQDPQMPSAVEYSALFSEDADAGDEDHLSAKWDFGDGTSGIAGAGTYQFEKAGTFTLVLTVTDPHGASSSAKATVVVPPFTLTVPTVRAVPRTKQVLGLKCQRITGNIANFSTFEAALPAASPMAALDIGLELRPRDENYGLRFSGFVSIPTTGVWRFVITSDDGSRLSLGGTEVAKMDQMQGATAASATVRCDAGLLPIQVDYYQGGGGQELRLEWSGPGQLRLPIPAAAYFHDP